MKVRTRAARMRRLGVLALALLSSTTAWAQFVEPDVVVIHQITGSNGEYLGWTADDVGDIDGDGVRELIASAPFNNAAGANAGRAYLYSGASGAQLAFFNGAAGYYLGAVNDAGDVSGDGVPDLILGGPGQPFNPTPGVNGRVWVYSGDDYSMLWTVDGEALNDLFGGVVAGLHDDADGDGHNDVLIGARGHDTAGSLAGRAYILSGVDGSTILTVDGLAAGQKLGGSITSVSDLDGDGLRDFVVGAEDAGGQPKGRAFVFSSATGDVIHTLSPIPAGAVDFGLFFIDAVGDMDGDLVDDIYVSDFSALGGQGRAYVHSGATGLRIRDWVGAAPGAGMGIGRGAGDVNGDGFADLYMAEWNSSAGASSGGKGLVLSGADGAVLQTMTGNRNAVQLGFDALALGDVNGDGRTDYVLTGNGATTAAAGARHGVIYVLAGTVDFACEGDLNGDRIVDLTDLAQLLADFDCTGGGCAGDVDGDGDTDLTDLATLLANFDATCG